MVVKGFYMKKIKVIKNEGDCRISLVELPPDGTKLSLTVEVQGQIYRSAGSYVNEKDLPKKIVIGRMFKEIGGMLMFKLEQ